MSSTNPACDECQSKSRQGSAPLPDSRPVSKMLAMLSVRRPRRVLVFFLPFLAALAFMTGFDPAKLGVQDLTTTPMIPTTLSDYPPTTDQRTFGLRLLDCLSFQHCPWSSTPPRTRSQTLQEDQQYLDVQHRALPRLVNPYPDIRSWSYTKRKRTLQGLEWLIANYDKRWPAGQGLINARKFNQDVFVRLHTCVERSLLVSQLGGGREPEGTREATECAPERMTVIMLGSPNFGRARAGRVSGEQIWARSIMDSYEHLGYSLLYSSGINEHKEIYTAIPDLVRLLIVDADHIKKCQKHGRPEWIQVLSESEIRKGAMVVHVQAQAKDESKGLNYTLSEWSRRVNDSSWASVTFFGHPPFPDKPQSSPITEDADPSKPAHSEWDCTQTPEYPQGIPLWKMFAMHFWDTSNEHPLGGLWTLAPEPYSTFPQLAHRPEHNLYMGYSIAAYCRDAVPASQRLHQAYILAKLPKYFDPPSYAFSNHTFSDIEHETGITFVAGTGEPGSALPDPGITNLGVMNATTFRDVLAHSKALVGIGRPGLSPTPYDALCMGVPFINSVTWWDKQDPDDQSKWGSQHDALFDIGEPHVYHVKQGDQVGLKTALEKALETPIEPFVPTRMTERAVEARYRMLVETDWEGVYRERSDFP